MLRRSMLFCQYKSLTFGLVLSAKVSQYCSIRSTKPSYQSNSHHTHAPPYLWWWKMEISIYAKPVCHSNTTWASTSNMSHCNQQKAQTNRQCIDQTNLNQSLSHINLLQVCLLGNWSYDLAYGQSNLAANISKTKY